MRLSRTTVDDSISAHLNALLTPSRTNPFLSSSSANLSSLPRGDRRNVPDEACHAFKQTILFPRWATRDYVLTACQRVANGASATGDDALDPSATGPQDASRTSRNYWGYEQSVNERLDPYSGRNYDWTRQPEAQQLRDVLQSELQVENIVRSRTWAVLGERCARSASSPGKSNEEQWRQEYRAWKRSSNA